MRERQSPTMQATELGTWAPVITIAAYYLAKLDPDMDEAIKHAIGPALFAIGVWASSRVKDWRARRNRIPLETGLVLLLLVVCVGCAGSIGVTTPADCGECGLYETKGVQWAFGESSVGADGAVTGGSISEAFAGVVSVVADAAMRLVGALLSPFGAIGAAGESLSAGAAP